MKLSEHEEPSFISDTGEARRPVGYLDTLFLCRIIIYTKDVWVSFYFYFEETIRCLRDVSLLSLQLLETSSRASGRRRRSSGSTFRPRSRRRSSRSETVFDIGAFYRLRRLKICSAVKCGRFCIFRQRRQIGRHPAHRTPHYKDEAGRPETSARHPVRQAGEGVNKASRNKSNFDI